MGPIESMYGIYSLHLVDFLMVNVGKYTSPMDPMGHDVPNGFGCEGNLKHTPERNTSHKIGGMFNSYIS